MSSSGRRSAVSNKTAGAGRPGSSNKKIPTPSNTPGSSSKTGAEHGVRNKSNSAAVNEKRQLPESDRRIAPNKVGTIDGKIKVLGQDAELTETEIWNMNGVSSGKSTPLSSRSSTFRTPTPSKQISLQAVRRKEERDEVLETIDWNDFVRPVSEAEERSDSMLDDRIPTPELTESDDSDADSGMTMEDRLQLVEKRAHEMTSALSSHPLNDMEENLSKQLEKVEIEREEQDKIERQKQDNGVMGVIGNKERQNNENFREFGPVSHRPVITDSEIVGANSQSGGFIFNPGASMDLDKGPSSDVNFTVGARPKQIKGDNESQKKADAIEQKANSLQGDDTKSSSSDKKDSTVETVEESSSSDEEDDEDDENDLIGHKGKAPNELLMEFLDCMMKEEYETAEKLCKMILIYEPNNQEALNFYPLIQMKIQQEEEEETDSESDSDDEDSGDDSDGDDDDDNDDDEDDSSEDSDEDGSRVPDSGIVSAANSD